MIGTSGLSFVSIHALCCMAGGVMNANTLFLDHALLLYRSFKEGVEGPFVSHGDAAISLQYAIDITHERSISPAGLSIQDVPCASGL
jgi:hypothetical protein